MRFVGLRSTSQATESVAQSAEIALLARAAETLARAEAQIELTARLGPADVDAEAARLLAAFARGEALVIGWKERPPAELASTRRALEQVRGLGAALGPFGELYAERAAELELEARLVEALGTTGFRELAAERFPSPGPAVARECDDFVAQALALPPEVPASLHRSDDDTDPRSLVSRLKTRARELGLGVRIRVSREQLATAATGDRLVVVRAGVLLAPATAERIAVHELFAHALPRERARYAKWPLLRAGTRRSSDHEEGRALLIEQRAGFLDAERGRELAWRHVAAVGVRRGAEPRDTVLALLERGAPLERAIALTLRVQRGGGLARELVYLPSYFAVTRAFAGEPGLERWFERGRVDLAAARAFERALPASAPSDARA
jgi:hypothetical protein